MRRRGRGNTTSGGLPALYADWMDQLLGEPIPEETEATCSDCAMCVGRGERPPAGKFFFDPLVKCCSFLPVLPNFLVGRILADRGAGAAGARRSVAARIGARVAVTPLGLARSAKYALLYEHGSRGFGQSRTLRCPHFVEQGGGRCAIWRHREAVCATYFCKHVRGAVGVEFWRSVRHLLGAVERNLAQWCAAELDLGTDVLRRLFAAAGAPDGKTLDAAELDDKADTAAYMSVWGKWAGHERHFYTECARRVKDLPWKDVTALCGPEVRVNARLACETHARLMATKLPLALRVGTLNVFHLDAESACVSAYSGTDPLELPTPLLSLLHYFDGRPTREALAAMAGKENIALGDGLVRKLADFHVLVDPEHGPPPDGAGPG
jgi:Fe-S-cluster containining protein